MSTPSGLTTVRAASRRRGATRQGRAALTAEKRERQEEKHALWAERRVVKWIEQVTGERRGEQSTFRWLRSGLVLCRLVNKIVPGLVKESECATQCGMIENIRRFLQVARSFGVREDELFAPLDLLEDQNIGKVVGCVRAFADRVPIAVPRYQGPELGRDEKHTRSLCAYIVNAVQAWSRPRAPPLPSAKSVPRFESYAVSEKSATGSQLVQQRFDNFAKAKQSSASLGSGSVGLDAMQAKTSSCTLGSSVEVGGFLPVPRSARLGCIDEGSAVTKLPTIDSMKERDLAEASTDCGSERCADDLVDIEV